MSCNRCSIEAKLQRARKALEEAEKRAREAENEAKRDENTSNLVENEPVEARRKTKRPKVEEDEITE